MKGKLIKIEERWMVGTVCYADLWSNYMPLHLDDESLWMFAELNEEWKDKLDGKEVEFEIVRYCKKHNSDPSKNSVCTLDCGYDEVSYAKLIPSKEQQKELITEIMNLDAKDGLYDTVNELDKLAEKTFKGDDATTFVQREIWKDGYNKAKETLYTEEQVNQEMIDFAEWCRIQYRLNGETFLIEQLFSEYKSLKQPKKD